MCALQSWGVPRPGGLLVSGPTGCGKTALLSAAAKALQRHPQCLTYPVVVRCREVASEGAGHAQAHISAKVRRVPAWGAMHGRLRAHAGVGLPVVELLEAEGCRSLG